MSKADESHQIDELREILNGASSSELAALKDRIANVEQRANDVAEVLAPAIERTDSSTLISSLKDPVSQSLKQAIRAEPEGYADILYPVMAPTIRRAISQAISSLMVTINQTVESAASVNGLKTRIQSLRTGVPYAELALRQSLLYRVEHVYLINRESGLQIAEVASQETQSLDGDAVSAMFSAIQSFVQDSFSRDPSAMLTDLKVGDHNVWIANGPNLMLACVIQGDAPEALKDDLYDALYMIRTNYANQIASFDGDLSDFFGVEELMSPLLQLRLKEGVQSEKNNYSSPKRPKVLLILICLAILFLVFRWFAHKNNISTIEYYLSKTPGVAVTDVSWRDSKFVIEGLKDPDAIIPYRALEAYELTKDKLDFQMVPFRSLEIDMELQRFVSELSLPSNMQLLTINDEILLIGEAPIEWLTVNGTRIAQLVADKRINASNLSASYDSVMALLKRYFSADELSLITVINDPNTSVLTIDSELSPNKRMELVELFYENQWVVVSSTNTSSFLNDSDTP